MVVPSGFFVHESRDVSFYLLFLCIYRSEMFIITVKVKVGTHLSEEFEVNVGVHQGSALSPLLFAIDTNVMKEQEVTRNIVCG